VTLNSQHVSFNRAALKKLALTALLLFTVSCGRQFSPRISSGEISPEPAVGSYRPQRNTFALDLVLEKPGIQTKQEVRAKHILCVGPEYTAGKLKKDLPPFFKDGNSINSGAKDEDGDEMFCPNLTNPLKFVCLADTYLFDINTGCPFKNGINRESLDAFNKYCKGLPNVAAFKKPAYLDPSDDQSNCKICRDLAGKCDDPADKSFTTASMGTYACLVKVPKPLNAE
jgi:hypothetical protein